MRPVLALAFVLAGCASVDLDLAVERGQARWFAATGRRPAPTAVLWTPSRTCGPITQAVGCAHTPSKVIHVWSGVRSQDYLDRVMLHELGHLLAPGHVESWAGVMAPHIDWSSAIITQADLDLVCLGFLCPWERPERPAPP